MPNVLVFILIVYILYLNIGLVFLIVNIQTSCRYVT
jgi:hypothetical protein